MITAKRAEHAKRSPYFRTHRLSRALFALFANFAVNLCGSVGTAEEGEGKRSTFTDLLRAEESQR